MIRYKEHTDLKNKLLKDMVPICFNVSVYLMDATRQRMEKSIISKEDKCRIQDEAVRTSDTSLLDELVLVNPISIPATLEDKEDIKASEIYDASQNIAKNNDGNFSGTEGSQISSFTSKC